jgi:hypothetical protein
MLYPGVKRLGYPVNHSQPLSTDVKTLRKYIFTPPIWLHGVQRESITFTLTGAFYIAMKGGTVLFMYLFI